MKIQDILKYIFSIFLAGILLWYVLKEQNIKEVAESIKDLHWGWLILSSLTAILSHYFRGLRWGLMLKPLNLKTSNSNLFMATMSGYAGNVIIPRFGEFFRCGILQKLSGIPAKTSFGAVVIERAIDLVVFIILFSIAFFSQFDILYQMVLPFLEGNEAQMNQKFILLGAILLFFITGIFILYKVRDRLSKTKIYRTIHSLILGVIEGMQAVFKLKRKEFIIYIAYTIAIWLCYFYMSYVVFKVLDETAHLSLFVGFVMMMMSGLGMVIPTPGGTGSVHFFASQTLMAYGISATTSIAYALVMHTSQTVMILTVGGISIIIANFKKGHQQTTLEIQNEAQ
ncbi:lysylphosphatidylglycerol synthase transmembrane domain-containing protein [Flammeovirga agarivorans]|uniref:Flippase-like domain-containing protein n=1 Tax=Flammeovirga agarivorans TaxID=2726742 RepID=A0A7X8XYI0_9BACT|nr:lysylphosphatidylglycerol synthase transmembrane domain-containing protein [Flammeovirga agarivorans]NLR94234.1 flippase-like domain-containing protein [Flammeovirga agarivorans]